MGLLDVLNGMQKWARVAAEPDRQQRRMSPITMAIIALLGYKALKSFTGHPKANPTAPGSATRPASLPGQNTNAGGGLGDLLRGGLGGLVPGAKMRMLAAVFSDLLKGGLGGLLAGGAAGSVHERRPERIAQAIPAVRSE